MDAINILADRLADARRAAEYPNHRGPIPGYYGLGWRDWAYLVAITATAVWTFIL